MSNKDIERLMQLYIKGWITKKEFDKIINEMEENDKSILPEPPTVY